MIMSTEGGSIKVLIIENDNSFRLNLSQHLRDEQHLVFEVVSKSETSDILQKEDIDIVLLGLDSLKREGLTILKMIKDVNPLIEVITMNNSEQLALSIESMKLGAFDDFLIPFDLDSLLIRIQQAYEKNKKENQTI